MAENITVYVTIKSGDKQKSFEFAPNKDKAKDTDRFLRVGSPSELFLTSTQGLYVNKDLARKALEAKTTVKAGKKA